jgi:hypothetical protein
VKGVSEPVNVYEITGLGPLRTRLGRSTGRGLTKFVGRERELEQMRHALEQVRTGRGQIIAAMGEAGVGKSRMFFEFKAFAQSECLVLEAFSVSHGKASSYLPVIELLHDYFRITTEDDGRERSEKVIGKVLGLDRALEHTLPYLFALLGIEESDGTLAQMDGQVRRRRTQDAIKNILLRESFNQPLIVVFDRPVHSPAFDRRLPGSAESGEFCGAADLKDLGTRGDDELKGRWRNLYGTVATDTNCMQ